MDNEWGTFVSAVKLATIRKHSVLAMVKKNGGEDGPTSAPNHEDKNNHRRSISGGRGNIAYWTECRANGNCMVAAITDGSAEEG